MEQSNRIPNRAVIVFIPKSEPNMLGGLDSYAIRMFNYLKEHNYKIYYMHEETSYAESSLTEVVRELGIDEIILEPFSTTLKLKIKTMPDTVNRETATIIICLHDIFLFFIAEQFKHMHIFSDVDIFLYVLHPYVGVCTDINANINSSALQHTVYLVYKHFLKKMHFNKSIVYMDEESRDFISNHYKLQEGAHSFPIARLCMSIRPFQLIETRSKTKLDSFTILSMARFDFPFKGYLIGLIDEFAIIRAQYPFTKLSIIGNGKDEHLLRQKISMQTNETQNAITLHGKIEYKDLGDYFNRANLFLGMGTTLLDATNHGVLSIIVDAYQTECNCLGFFHDHITELGKIENSIKLPASNLIAKVLRMSPDEYSHACEHSHKVFKATYDIESIMPKLLYIKNTTQDAVFPLWFVNTILKIKQLLGSIKRTAFHRS